MQKQNNPFTNRETRKTPNYTFIKLIFFMFAGLFLFSCATDSASFTRPTKLNGISFLSQRDLPDSNNRVPTSARVRTVENSSQESQGVPYIYNTHEEVFQKHFMILLMLNVFQAFIIAVLGYILIKRKT